MLAAESIIPYQPTNYKLVSDDSRGQCQLIALANDYLRRLKGVKAIEQERYWKANDVRINANTLSRWRTKWIWLSGSHNYRLNAVCRFWGLSFEDMLAIGREEKKRVDSLPPKVKRVK